MSSESKNSENMQPPINSSQQQTENGQEQILSGKQITVRLLYTILFLLILGIVLVIVKLVVIFQFIYLFSTRKPNESVRQFSNKISAYGYRIFRYVTLNEGQRPFPFADLSPELDPSENPFVPDERL